MKLMLSLVLAAIPLSAQAPPEWGQKAALGSEYSQQGWWYGAGSWAGNHGTYGPTLTDSLGLGNSLVGGGLHVEAGWKHGNWDVAAEVLGNRAPDGQTYATLYRSHLWYRGDRGWQGGFEQEPLVWGYGLNGGYLLGEAARPFPRMRIESPMADLHIWRVPLGSWGFQAFMGRMENHPVFSSDIQDPSWERRVLAANGTPEAPFLNGYRVQAQFGPLMEFYINLMSMWGGTLNGRSMLDGYSVGDYFISMTGMKDGLTEGGTDFLAGQVPPPPTTKAMSTAEADVGFRLQTPFLSRALNADKSYVYVSRGSKSAAWPYSVFAKDPVHYLGEDLKFDINNLLRHPNLGNFWMNQYRYSAPTLQQPNDTVGVLVVWPGVRAGLEYFACSDTTALGFRPFTHEVYLTGFYYYGDPLGNPLGGESVSTTAKVAVDFAARLTGTTTLTRGFRPFRDNPADWQQDHPGAVPVKNRFTILQQTLDWKATANATLGLGASWQRQDAVLNVTGAKETGTAWFADADYRWPAHP